jgi:hypothetical protein
MTTNDFTFAAMFAWCAERDAEREAARVRRIAEHLSRRQQTARRKARRALRQWESLYRQSCLPDSSDLHNPSPRTAQAIWRALVRYEAMQDACRHVVRAGHCRICGVRHAV